MRVTIDATPLLLRSAGVKNYLYYWIQSLRQIAGQDVIRTFPSIGRLRPLNHEGSAAGAWQTCSGLASIALANRTALPVADWIGRGSDIFHATNLLHRPPGKPRLTVTIHDLTCWLMPELHRHSNVLADEFFLELMKRAHAAIAVSENTRNDAIRILRLPPEKITVIHSGVSPAFFAVSEDAAASVRRRYQLDRPFILFVGTIEPRKNIDTLLDAYGALAPSLRAEFDLVLAGPTGWARPETLGRLQKIRYLGYIPERDLAPLTAAATVFAYPSLYEGFGFPVVQAMAAGVPVITSNVSSLPEVAGDAALLVDPRSISELSSALARLLLSDDLRRDLALRGRRRAGAFRWQDCARKSVEFFQRISG
jgi:glycosyltransferase involved in cell wall biosynthesis